MQSRCERPLHGVILPLLPALLPIRAKEEAGVKYYNAKKLLPEALVRELQLYVQGGYIYVPATGERKQWGEVSGYRCELAERNREIRLAYQAGVSVDTLAGCYHLSPHAIRKIIYTK